MGQYKVIQRYRLIRQRRREQLEKQLLKQELDFQQIPKLLSEDYALKTVHELTSKVDEEFLYHWFNEPPGAEIEVKTQVLRKYLDRLKMRLGAMNHYDLLLNKLKVPRLKAYEYLGWLKWPVVRVKVAELLEFCKYLKLDLRQLERDGAFTRKFPVNLRSPAIIKLKTHILNEGALSLRKDSGQPKAKYVNKDPVLHYYVLKLLEELGVKVKKLPRYDKSKGTYTIDLDATTARILRKAGIPPGRKTITNPKLDPKIYFDDELRKYHFQATLTEEGTSSLRIKRRKLIMRISWGRSIDITDELSPCQREKIKQIIPPGNRMAVGKLLRKIKAEDPQLSIKIAKIIRGNQPNLLNAELAILRKFHGDAFKKEFSVTYPERVHVSKGGNITVLWRVYVDKPDLIDLIVKEYGMLPGTWKEERLKRQLEIYYKYKDKDLRGKELEEIYKLLESLPKRITKEWMIQKYRDVFEKQEEFKSNLETR